MRRAWNLVESSDGLESALASGGAESLADRRFVCSSPNVFYELRRRGLAVRSLHEYLTYPRQNAILEALEPVVAGLCRRLDEELHSSWPGLPGGFRPFDAMEFQLKAVLDALAVRSHQLDEFIEAERPASLRLWSSSARELSGDRIGSLESSAQLFAWRREESALATLLRQGGWQEKDGLSIEETPLAERPLEGEPRASLLEGLAARVLNLNLVTGLLRLGVRGRGGGEGQPGLAIVSRTEETVAFLRKAVEQAGYSVDWWSRLEMDPVSMRTGRTIRIRPSAAFPAEQRWEARTVGAIVRRAWESAEVDLPEPLNEAARSRLSSYSVRRIPVLLRLFHRVCAYLEARRPRAVLTGTRVSDTIQVVGQACGAASTLLVSFQHGGNIGYNHVERLRRSDLKGKGLYATFGPGVTRHLEEVVRENALKTSPVTLGWRRQAVSRSARHAISSAASAGGAGVDRGANEPIILYVATRLLGDLRHGSAHWYDDVSYFLYQTELMDLLASVEGTRTVVKLHRKEHLENPLPAYSAERRLDLEVVRDGELVDWLEKAAVVLIDYPSTTLLEALALEKRVVYLDLGVLGWFEAAARELERSAIWVATDEGWQRRIRQAIGEALEEEWPFDPEAFCRDYSSPRYTPEGLLAAIGRPRDG